MDIVKPAVRSRMMAGIRNKHTKPEIVVRHLLHGSGFRYRLHQSRLPGAPDIVLAKYRTAVFVHGCFWHQHRGCRLAKMPSSNVEFWEKKLHGNRARDQRHVDQLRASGWRVLTVWECVTRDPAQWPSLAEHMAAFIRGTQQVAEFPDTPL